MLFSLTFAVNYLAMAAALWLGLYIVSRSSRRLISWLASLTLWFLSGLFLNVLFALTPPPVPDSVPGWLLPLYRFCVPDTIAGANSWLHKWQATPVIMLWYHTTVRLRYKELGLWQWISILLGYGTAISVILMQAYTSELLYASPTGDPLYLGTVRGGPLYPLFIAFGVVYMLMSLYNLVRSALTAPALLLRKQFVVLIAATVTTGAALLLSVFGTLLGLRIPTVIVSALLALTVVLLGYGVARYSAMSEGRTMQRDFYYNAVAGALVVGLYSLVTAVSVQFFGVPAVAFIFVISLAIVTHSLVGLARRNLDRFLYRRDARRVRANLRRLVRMASVQDDVGEILSLALDSICTSARATYGLLLLFRDGIVQQAASFRWHGGRVTLSSSDLVADDVTHLAPNQLEPPLADASLLIPLYSYIEQFGALLLGRPVNGISYSEQDVDTLLYPSDRLADAIRDMQRRAESLAQVSRVAEADRAQERYPDHVAVKAVEDALRNLVDYAYLGDHALSRFQLVQSRVEIDVVTHVDLGKAVHNVLAEAIERLRPDDLPADDPPSREWYPYLILHDAYFKDIPNRDIMTRLYISEGTFNRTRRGALQAVARMLEEMESAVN